MRWQSGESRHAVVWFGSNADSPATGLSPTVLALRVSDGAGVASPAVAEVGAGFYRFSFTAPSSDSFAFLVDGGASLDNAHRYVPVEVPVGGFVDLLDVAVSSRASAAQAAADSPGTVTLLTLLTSTRAGLLDALALLDVAVSTRATPADVTVTSPSTYGGVLG